jgi:anti-sigma B factor antagonist
MMQGDDDTRSAGTWIERGPLVIRSQRDPDEVHVLELYGELDLSGAEVLSRELQRAEASHVKQILVDLSGLDFIDSSGMRVLMQAHDRLQRNSSRLSLLRGSGQVAHVMAVTKLDSVLPFAD